MPTMAYSIDQTSYDYTFNVVYKRDSDNVELFVEELTKRFEAEKDENDRSICGYYAERDLLPGKNIIKEHFRVIKASRYTIIVIDIGFMKDPWPDYLSDATLKTLIEDGPEKEGDSRLIVISMNVAKETIKERYPQLVLKEMVYFAGDYATDNSKWNKLIRVIRKEIKVSEVDEPIREDIVILDRPSDERNSPGKSLHPQGQTGRHYESINSVEDIAAASMEVQQSIPVLGNTHTVALDNGHIGIQHNVPVSPPNNDWSIVRGPPSTFSMDPFHNQALDNDDVDGGVPIHSTTHRADRDLQPQADVKTPAPLLTVVNTDVSTLEIAGEGGSVGGVQIQEQPMQGEQARSTLETVVDPVLDYVSETMQLNLDARQKQNSSSLGARPKVKQSTSRTDQLSGVDLKNQDKSQNIISLENTGVHIRVDNLGEETRLQSRKTKSKSAIVTGTSTSFPTTATPAGTPATTTKSVAKCPATVVTRATDTPVTSASTASVVARSITTAATFVGSARASAASVETSAEVNTSDASSVTYSVLPGISTTNVIGASALGTEISGANNTGMGDLEEDGGLLSITSNESSILQSYSLQELDIFVKPQVSVVESTVTEDTDYGNIPHLSLLSKDSGKGGSTVGSSSSSSNGSTPDTEPLKLVFPIVHPNVEDHQLSSLTRPNISEHLHPSEDQQSAFGSDYKNVNICDTSNNTLSCESYSDESRIKHLDVDCSTNSSTGYNETEHPAEKSLNDRTQLSSNTSLVEASCDYEQTEVKSCESNTDINSCDEKHTKEISHDWNTENKLCDDEQTEYRSSDYDTHVKVCDQSNGDDRFHVQISMSNPTSGLNRAMSVFSTARSNAWSFYENLNG